MRPKRPPIVIKRDADGRRRQLTLRALPLTIVESLDRSLAGTLWADELVVQLRRLDGTVLHETRYDLRFLLGVDEVQEEP